MNYPAGSGTAGPMMLYQKAVDAGDLDPDPAQHEAMLVLQDLHDQLEQEQARLKGNLFSRFFGLRGEASSIRGLYLWGGVGRGKTCLMDMFCRADHSVPVVRMHFHRFMKRVHDDLRRLRNTANPLQVVARRLADETRVLCFDEFFVSDIGDAMLLAGLLQTLFEEGVVLVATSNIPPHRLYERGLQRQQFVPAIRLIEKHTRVLEMDGGTDYRRHKLEQAGLYFSPLGEEATRAMAACFESLSGGQKTEGPGEIEILGRRISCQNRTEGVLWSDFHALCETPRSAMDYIELAHQYHTVLLSNVPGFRADRDDGARRFIALVDEFYDRRVKLVISAAALPVKLYSGTELAFAFERTASRLTEMQSPDYLAAGHLP